MFRVATRLRFIEPQLASPVDQPPARRIEAAFSLRIGYALESDLTFCRRLMHVLLPFRVTIRTGLSNGVSYCRLTG
jgi:hypothetical protein